MFMIVANLLTICISFTFPIDFITYPVAITSWLVWVIWVIATHAQLPSVLPSMEEDQGEEEGEDEEGDYLDETWAEGLGLGG